MLAFGLIVATTWASFVGCGPSPQTSDTKTNWFRECDSQAQCGTEGNCLCGICTALCDANSPCESGSCGSTVATTGQCAEEADDQGPQQICLPTIEELCSEVPLPIDGPLGVTPQMSCATAGALICEDFEASLPSEFASWVSEGDWLLQDCQAHASVGALSFVGADTAWAQTRMRLPSPVTTGALHARFYLKISNESVLPEQLILFELWDADEGAIPERTTLYLNADEALEVFVGASMQTVAPTDSTALTRDEWHCVELSVDMSDTAGAVTVKLENQSIVSGSGFDTLPMNPTSVAVVEALQGGDTSSSSVEIFIDDLVIGTQPIGCLP